MLGLDSTHGELENYHENHHFVYPSGKPRILHLRRCQGLAIAHDGFTLGRLGSTAFSPFATLGFTHPKASHLGRKKGHG
jgi:hypothetical protein